MQTTVLFPKLLSSFLGLKTPESRSPEMTNRAVRQGEADTYKLGELMPKAAPGQYFSGNYFLYLANAIETFKDDSFKIDQVRLSHRCSCIKQELAKIHSGIDNLDLPGKDFKERLKAVFTDFSRLGRFKLGPKKQMNKASQCCQALSELKDELVSYYFSALKDPAAENKPKIASIVARSIPAGELSVTQVETLFEHVPAPLRIEIDRVVERRVHYTKDLLQATLDAKDFKNYLPREYDALPTDSKRKLHLLMFGREDTLSKEAMELLIYGSDKKTVDPSVIAGVAVLRADLIAEHKLTDLLMQQLPLKEELNRQLIEAAASDKKSAFADTLLDQLFKGAELLHDPEFVKRSFQIEDSASASQIANLAKIFKYRADLIALAESYL